MKLRVTSAFGQAMLLIAMTALVVQAANIIAVSQTPTPSELQLSLREAAGFLLENDLAEAKDIPVVVEKTPPSGSRDPLLEEVLALLLDVPSQRVRVVFERGATVQVFMPESFEQSESDTPTRVRLPDIPNLPEETRDTLENAPLPQMKASLQRSDGRWVTVGAPSSFWSDWRFRLSITFIATLLVLMPLAWWAASRTTRPLRKLAKHVLALETGTPASAPLEGSREMRAVAQSIDQLRKRLDAQLADRERIVAAMAHDLRTPLTGLRLRAEQAPEPARKRMIDDIKRMEAMISDVIDYSHSRQPRPSSTVDLAELVRACVKEAAMFNIARVEGADSPIQVQGDAVKLRRAVSNLIGNAQKYGGAAETSIHVVGGLVQVHVDDSGPGIPDDKIERLLEPFQRGEDSRNRSTGGSGLGLTVARDVALYHGGKLLLRNRSEGGLCAILELPHKPSRE